MEKNGTYSLFDTSKCQWQRDVCMHDVLLYQRIHVGLMIRECLVFGLFYKMNGIFQLSLGGPRCTQPLKDTEETRTDKSNQFKIKNKVVIVVTEASILHHDGA